MEDGKQADVQKDASNSPATTSPSNEPSLDEELKAWKNMLRQLWFTTSLEKDKSIITLSSAGLALLIAFVTRSSPKADYGTMEKMILLLGLCGFTASILAGVRCLGFNREVAEALLADKDEPKSLADDILRIGFLAGVFAVALIGIAAILSL